MKADSASITARFSSSVPMVMRKRVGQAVFLDPAQDDAPLMQEVVGLRRRPAVALGKMQQQEIRGARRHAKAEARQRLGDAATPQLVVLGAPLHPGLILERRHAGGNRRAGDVERTSDAVQRVGDLGRAIGPADAERGEPVDLGEGARHHRVRRWWRPARCRPRNRSCAHIRHRPRRARAARRAASPRAGASPRRRRDRCRSGCSDWR